MKEPKQHYFVKHLERLRDAKNRAALAHLRRGLGKKTGTPDMYPYVVPFLKPTDSKWDQERCFLVASLFALHPDKATLGASMGKVFKKIADESESVEKRFINLLSTDIADIGGHLRQAVSLAKSRNVPVDYHRLFYDLKHWNNQDKFIQLQWAKDFWTYKEDKNQENQTKGEKK